MKKIVLFLLLTMTGFIQAMLSQKLTHKNKGTNNIDNGQLLKSTNSIEQNKKIKVLTAEEQKQLFEKEKFIKDRIAFWIEHLKGLYREGYNLLLVVQKLIEKNATQFAQADWERHNWESSSKAEKRYREVMKRFLH